MIRRFLNDSRGNFATMFAVALVPLIGMTGAVVDYTNGFHKRELVQSALDAAAIAANRLNGVRSDNEVRAEAQAVFNANLAGKFPNPPTLTVSIASGEVTTTTHFSVTNRFLGIAGFDLQSYSLSASSVVGGGTFEVVMVLDNSGSMWGSKISTLRVAARDLVDALFDSASNSRETDPVKIGIVPFSRAVNVGTNQRNASWMDGSGAGVGTYHHEHFDAPVNRFALFDQIRNVSWQGCVEARPYPFDVQDTPATSGDPRTMFVPYFAPDEPDGSYSFYNSYIRDAGRSCRGVWRLNQQQRQELTCKYNGSWVNGWHQNGVRYGPNVGCTARPLTPMTTNRGQLLSTISGLQASGMTNIGAGIAWGWRVLSPGAPFTEGRPYRTPDNNKILIVMTDGANTYNTAGNFNRSGYGAYSYVVKNHLGTTSWRNSDVTNRMDARTAETCTNVKAEGIMVYTIAFQVSDADTRRMMRECATRPDMAFESDNNSELLAAFDRIGGEITELRLSR